jgi:hypothetical protein
MEININRFDEFAAKGMLQQFTFGDLKNNACLLSALAGGKSLDQCTAAGWPKWLAEIGIWLFDTAPTIETAINDGHEFALAVTAFDARKGGRGGRVGSSITHSSRFD